MNAGEVAYLILASVVHDFEGCNELGWKMALKYTIHLFCSGLHLNLIVVTPVVPKVENTCVSRIVDVVYFSFLEDKNRNSWL